MFSIFSMELWGGQMDEFDDGYPRANHDSFLQAMLLWFIVTTGESWVDYMWSAMRPGVKNRWVSPFIFIFYYMITAYVILNLIIATILEEMELTDNQKKHLQKREHLKWLQTKHFHGVSEKRSSDWLVGAVQGAQKGLKDVRRRMSSLKISRKSILPVSSSKTADVPQQQEVDDSFQTPSSPEGVSMSQEVSTKRSSYSALDTSVSSEEDVQSKARVRRRSSLSSLNPGIDKPLIRRSRSQEMDRSLLRSGDTASNLAATVNGGNRFVLQSAVLAIADDQALVAAADKKKVTISKQVENDEQSPATSKNPAYSRTRSVRGVSFLLSEFQEAPAVVEKVVPWWLSSRSLFLFQRDNVFRVFITKLIEHPVYLAWECLWIFLGVYALIRQSPMGPYLDNWINYSEYGHAAVFLVDLFFKLIAYGLIFTPEPYLGDPFNLIDFLNLLFSLIRLRMYWSDGGSRPTFDLAARCLMTVRPFRLIARFAGLRNLCLYIVKTIPAISQVFLFTLVVYAIYAVIGLQLYADRFRFCSDPDAESHLDCVGIFRNDVGIMAPRTWMNQDFNFDNFGNAMLSLFVVSTFDSWPSRFLYPAMDLGHKIGLQPRRNQSPSHAIYFVSFVCIGGFFILRMFVGVFIDQFGIISGRKLLTERQKLWRDTNRLIQGLRPKRVPIIFPTYGVRRLCFQAVYNRKFELLLVFVVMVNFLYLTTVQVGSNEKVPLLLTENRGGYQVIEVMFVCLYIVEAIMKLVGTQVRTFISFFAVGMEIATVVLLMKFISQFRDWWDDKWNVMELCMAIISASCLYPGTNKKSFPAMVNIMSLMGIFLCFFASMGNFVFWNIRNGVCIEKHTRDFRDFSGSFLILLQITTLDDWSCFLIDLRVTSPQCLHTDSNTTDDCGFPVGGLIYVLVCVIVTTYIFSNIFIAQILDTITFGLLRDEVLLSPDHVMAFQALWSKSDYDPRCTGYLGQHKLKDFFIELGPPLGGRGPQFLKRAFSSTAIQSDQRNGTGKHQMSPPSSSSVRYTRIVFEVNHFRDGKGVAFRPLLETVCLYKIGPRVCAIPPPPSFTAMPSSEEHVEVVL
ncbi:hypothetical protein AXG93_4188s1100 [Marchantia polymorpha subsp. ruderalis]|uniref:Ion transport domain-containing protein n=1 Tax=Marchantia polymorpha subsp. ruderalis TaxID=1480154 RepID=A0A176WDR3_MARPO|nr:hypothetical protein AXG93_4188s1100 [Marchantia polymorpha subsp. ruderalis]